MRVLMVADARSVHTRRWAASLNDSGVGTAVYSLYPSPDDFFEVHGIRLYVFDLFTYKSNKGVRAAAGALAMHIKAVADLKKVLRIESPDILHAHYATSFGLIAALTGFSPFIISVWGSDVYEFPYLSRINSKTVRFIFRKADCVLSTSCAMAAQTRKFTDKPIQITPFGVDISLFRKFEKNGAVEGKFVIGNVKTLAPKYGIDVLIRAFRVVRENNGSLPCKLVIIGDGPCRKEYEELARELGVSEDVEFVGKVPNNELPWWYNSFSVAVSLSRSESFGVVAVEAMACGCPVVVSDADGFREVVQDGITGFVVPKEEPQKAAAAIQRFIDSPSLREVIGNNGIEHVKSRYSWKDCVAKMISIYSDVRKSKGKNS